MFIFASLSRSIKNDYQDSRYPPHSCVCFIIKKKWRWEAEGSDSSPRVISSKIHPSLRNILLQGSHWSYFDLCHLKKEILPPHLEPLLEVLDSLRIFIYIVLMMNEDEDGNISSSLFPLLWHSYSFRFMLPVIAIFSFLDFSASITCLSFPSSPFIPSLDSVSSTFLSKENHWSCFGAVFFFTPWLFLSSIWGTWFWRNPFQTPLITLYSFPFLFFLGSLTKKGNSVSTTRKGWG